MNSEPRPLIPLEKTAHTMSRWLGSTPAFVLVLLGIVGWFIARPWFSSTEAWQNAIMVTLAIVTFLLLFMLQRAQNKALLSIHLKLNEILASQQGASNRLIGIENLTEAEVAEMHEHFQSLVNATRAEKNPCAYHTVEESAGS
jgi:low affinity Fe/Cu permease